jgi:hypothetical protein
MGYSNRCCCFTASEAVDRKARLSERSNHVGGCGGGDCGYVPTTAKGNC